MGGGGDGASHALLPKRRQRRVQTLEIAVHGFRFVSAISSEEMAVVVDVVVVAVSGRGYRFGNVSQIVLFAVVAVVVSHVDDPSFRRKVGIARTRMATEIVATTIVAGRRGLHHAQRIAVDRSIDPGVRIVGGIPGTGRRSVLVVGRFRFGKEVEFLLLLLLLLFCRIFLLGRRFRFPRVVVRVVGRTATVMRRVDFVVGIGFESAAAPLFGEGEASHDDLVVTVRCVVRCPWMGKLLMFPRKRCCSWVVSGQVR